MAECEVTVRGSLLGTSKRGPPTWHWHPMWPPWGKEQETKAPPPHSNWRSRKPEEGAWALKVSSKSLQESWLPVLGVLVEWDPVVQFSADLHQTSALVHLDTTICLVIFRLVKGHPNPCGLLLFTASAFPPCTWGSESLPKTSTHCLDVRHVSEILSPQGTTPRSELVFGPHWTQCPESGISFFLRLLPEILASLLSSSGTPGIMPQMPVSSSKRQEEPLLSNSSAFSA